MEMAGVVLKVWQGMQVVRRTYYVIGAGVGKAQRCCCREEQACCRMREQAGRAAQNEQRAERMSAISRARSAGMRRQ